MYGGTADGADTSGGCDYGDGGDGCDGGDGGDIQSRDIFDFIWTFSKNMFIFKQNLKCYEL